MTWAFNYIAERLKDVPRDNYRHDRLCAEARDEIVELHKRLDALTDERDALMAERDAERARAEHAESEQMITLVRFSLFDNLAVDHAHAALRAAEGGESEQDEK